MNILARVYCSSVQEYGAPSHDSVLGSVNGEVSQQQVMFSAIYSSSDDDPNRTFSQATPNMKIEMTVTNPAAFGAFVPGHIYDLTFSPTKDPAAAGAS